MTSYALKDIMRNLAQNVYVLGKIYTIESVFFFLHTQKFIFYIYLTFFFIKNICQVPYIELFFSYKKKYTDSIIYISYKPYTISLYILKYFSKMEIDKYFIYL